MRPTYTKAVLYKDANNVPYAINIGADYCAEHERGIGILWKEIGANQSEDGLKRYTATNDLKPLLFTKTIGGFIYLTFGNSAKWLKVDIATARKKVTKNTFWGIDRDEDRVRAAWSSTNFGLSVSKKMKNDTDQLDFIKELIKAIKKGDLAVWFGGEGANNPFARAGLVIAIASRVPKEVDDYMKQCHEDEHKLEAADKATGIHDLFKAKELHVWCCKPSWVTDPKEKERTIHPIHYWLNHKDYYGWFTVEELVEWANGVEGNAVETKKNAKR